MFPVQGSRINSDESSGCDERSQKTDQGKSLSSSQKTDAAIKESIYQALWKDDVLRAIEYSEIEVQVKNGFAGLYGHIVGTTSQNRIENAMRTIPRLLGIKNNLVLDDKLTLEVAASLGSLEHSYGCKFFTGASHGVVSLNGTVSDENVKLLAGKSVASNPNVRAVINNVHVSGTLQNSQEQPFLQPVIGEIIYFLDGIFGIVKQVIINPDNRRVIAMTIQGRFTNNRQFERNLTADGKARFPEQLVVVPMKEVRHLTRDSGFLYINSHDINRSMAFNPARFIPPKNGWKAPHPYCRDEVLFPVEMGKVEYQTLEQLPRSPFVVMWEEPSLREELLVNDSLGG